MSEPYVFISYSRHNYPFVENLRADLQRAGVAFYLDTQGLRTGTPDWEKALRTAISGSIGLILIASPASYSSPYVRDELALARSQGKPIYPIWAEGEKWHDCVPMGYGSIQYADARGANYTAGIARLLDDLQVGRPADIIEPQPSNSEVASAPSIGEPRNPYKGLRAFRQEDQGDFFGRETLVNELLNELRGHLPFLAVVGPSGSGKSSIIMAGLLPRLQMGALESSSSWIYLPSFVPGERPLRSMAEAIATALPQKSTFTILDELDHASGLGLHTLARQIIGLHPDRHVVLYIDQFEELFTLTRDEHERLQFINLLVASANEPGHVLTILLSLRADFSDRPMAYSELGALLENHRRAILPMTLADLYDVVLRPAALPDVQVQFEGDLVTEIVFAVRDEIGGLPLLQFTLDKLFERRQGRQLTQAAYRDIGGLRGALAKHAEAILNGLSAEQQSLARALFMRLIEPGATEHDTTRRRAVLDELMLTDPEQTKLMRAVADTFVNARLLTTSENGGVQTIEVSHEALIREWEQLGNWVNAARDDLLLQKSISADAAEWSRRGRKSDDDGLYRGLVLQNAQDWAVRNLPSELEVAFIQASAVRRDELLELEERRTQELQKAAERAEIATSESLQAAQRARLARWIAAIVGGIAILISIGASGFSIKANNDIASAQTAVSQSTEVLATIQSDIQAGQTFNNSLRWAAASNSVQLSSGSADLAILLGIRALQTSHTNESVAVLSRAIAYASVQQYIGHSAGVYGVAYSLDGQYALTGSGDATARLWNVASGQEVRRFLGHTKGVWGVAFSPDGRYVLTSSFDQTARLWDVSNGHEIHQFVGHDNIIYDATFSPDGRYVLTSSFDQTARLWDVDSEQEVRRFLGHTDRVWSVAFSPDGRYVLTGSLDQTARLWDVDSGQEVRRFLNNSAVYGVAFSPDGRYALIGNDDGTVRLLEVASGQEVRRFLGHTERVFDVVFSPDGRFALTGSLDRTARLWDVSRGQAIRQFRGYQDGVYSVAFSPDGRFALTGSFDRTARLWEVAIEHEVRQFLDHDNTIRTAVYSPDGRYALTSSSDDTMQLLDIANGQEVRQFVGNTANIESATFSPDGRYALTGSDDGIARLWDVASGEEVRQFLSRTQNSSITLPIYGVAFSPDGRYALIGNGDGIARLWDVASGEEVRQFHDKGLLSVAYSPDGRYVLTGSFERTVRLWDVASGEEVRQFLGHTDSIQSLAFSPDGRYVVTGSNDRTARLWDVADGQEMHQFLGHTDIVYSVAFSPDGRYLLTGSRDNTARLWDVANRQEVRPFFGHTGIVFSAVFSPDGRYALTGSGDGTARLWIVNHEELLVFACIHVFRDFTSPERSLYGLPADATCPQFAPEYTPQPYLSPSPTWSPVPIHNIPSTGTALPTVSSAVLSRITPSPFMTDVFGFSETNTDTLNATPNLIPVTLQWTAFPSPTLIVPSWTPIPSPTGTKFEVRVAEIGENRGSIPPIGGQRWTYEGRAGEVLTIRVNADHPANDTEDRVGLLDTLLLVHAPDGRIFQEADDIQAGIITNSLIEGLVLPEDGTYEFEVHSWQNETSGAYTLIIESNQIAGTTLHPSQTGSPVSTQTPTPFGA